MANNSVRYPTELRERAVRMVLEASREGVYSSEWAAICAVAQMLGPTPETVRKWVRRAQAAVSGPSEDHRRRVVELERENRWASMSERDFESGVGFFRAGALIRDLESSGFYRPVSGQVRDAGRSVGCCANATSGSPCPPTTPTSPARRRPGRNATGG